MKKFASVFVFLFTICVIFSALGCGNSAGGGSGGGSGEVSPGWYSFTVSTGNFSETQYYYFDENGNILEAGTGSTKFTGDNLDAIQHSANYFTLKQSMTLTPCGKPSWGTRDNPPPAPPKITSLTLSTNALSLKVGETENIMVHVQPSSLQNSITLKWTNSNSSIIDCTTSSNSVTVTGKKTGTATISCSYNGHSASCKVTVEEEADPETEYINSNWWGETGTWVGFYKVYQGESLIIHYDNNGVATRGGSDTEFTEQQLETAFPQYKNMSQAIDYWNTNCPQNYKDEVENPTDPKEEKGKPAEIIPRKRGNYYEVYCGLTWGK